MEPTTDVLCLKVTDEQRDVIAALFNHYDWDYNEIDIADIQDQSASLNISHGQDGPQSAQSNAEDLFVPGYVIQQDVNSVKCPYCLCHPCITSVTNKQLWWCDESVSPHQRNSGLRKIAYRKFWTMLHHRQVWISPEYLERKANALGRDPGHKDYVYHRRDLMPNCVLKLVRTWYPNRPEVPYMGHMWE